MGTENQIYVHNSVFTKNHSHCAKSDAECLLRMPVGMLIGGN